MLSRTYTLFLFLMFLGISVSGQDKKAAKILDKVTQAYDAATSITIDFDIIMKFPEEDAITYVSKVVESKGKWYFENEEQKIYQDGKDIWVYIPSKNEVQINDYDPAESEDYFVSPVSIIRQYKDGGHKYQISEKTSTTTFIELIPTDEFSDYAKIRLMITNSSHEVKQVEVFNKDGSVAAVVVKNITTDKPYDASFFDFDVSKYPDIIVEDLRLD